MVRIGDEPDQHMLLKVTSRLDKLHREEPSACGDMDDQRLPALVGNPPCAA